MEVAPVWSYSLCRIHFTLTPSEKNLLIHVGDRAVTAAWINSPNQAWLLESEEALQVWGPSKENHLYPLASSIFRLETSAVLTSRSQNRSVGGGSEAQISQAHTSVAAAAQPPPPQPPRPRLHFASTLRSLSLILNTGQQICLLTSNKTTTFGTKIIWML